MLTNKFQITVFGLMLLASISCDSRNNNESNKQSQDQPDETFEFFFNKFGMDSSFQAERVKYPLPYLSYPDDLDELMQREIDFGKWRYRNLSDDSLSEEFEPVIEKKDSKSVTYSQRGIDNGILIMYDFSKIRGKWYLIKMTNASD